jgi:quercetin dioxygenase-like cupin family protein
MFQQVIAKNMISALPGVPADNPGWSQTLLSNFLITGEHTQGKATVIEVMQRKGQEPPRHCHPETDETFYVIEGELTFSVAGETISAPAGTTVFIERGKEHSFTVETETANTLILLMPAPTEKVQAQA